MIYRGTTPTHIFSFPFGQSEISKVFITYVQNGEVKIEKSINDVTFTSDNTIETTLTQRETLLFNKYSPYDKTMSSMILIQIRALLTDGEAWVSEVIRERVGDVLKDGVI